MLQLRVKTIPGGHREHEVGDIIEMRDDGSPYGRLESKEVWDGETHWLGEIVVDGDAFSLPGAKLDNLGSCFVTLGFTGAGNSGEPAYNGLLELEIVEGNAAGQVRPVSTFRFNKQEASGTVETKWDVTPKAGSVARLRNKSGAWPGDTAIIEIPDATMKEYVTDFEAKTGVHPLKVLRRQAKFDLAALPAQAKAALEAGDKHELSIEAANAAVVGKLKGVQP